MTGPTCSVLIPTFDRRDVVIRCLDHLARSDLGAERLEVIVVDDGSTDGTVAALRDREYGFASMTVRSQANAGPAAARNTGLAFVTSPVTLFVNDDTLLEPDAISAHLAVHRAHPGSMVLGTFDFVPSVAATALGRMLAETPHLFAHPLLRDGDILRADLAATCNLSVPSGAAVSAGFDARFPMAAEDVDFALRLEQSGLVLRFCAGARSLHDHAQTLEGLARTAKSRGFGAARLALKWGWHEQLLPDARRALLQPDELAQVRSDALEQLATELAGLDAAHMPSSEAYASLATIFRMGNVAGYLDEPTLARLATPDLVRA